MFVLSCFLEGGTQYVFDSTPENSVIMYLESMKADINSKDTYGCSPLHYAAMRGNEVAAKELLSCTGINIEVSQNPSKCPPEENPRCPLEEH